MCHNPLDMKYGRIQLHFQGLIIMINTVLAAIYVDVVVGYIMKRSVPRIQCIFLPCHAVADHDLFDESIN